MLFCEKNKVRITRKVQNTTLKSYRNAKKHLETQFGALFWYQCLKSSSKSLSNCLNFTQLALPHQDSICHDLQWKYPYLHNPLIQALVPLESPVLKQATGYDLDGGMKFTAKIFCSVQCAYPGFFQGLSQPPSGLGFTP